MPVSVAFIRFMVEHGIDGEDLLEAIRLAEEGVTPVRALSGHLVSGRILDVPASTWRKLRQKVIERDGPNCAYCGIVAGRDWQCDHVVPVARGGKSTLDNLKVSCPTCNKSKKDGTLSYRPKA